MNYTGQEGGFKSGFIRRTIEKVKEDTIFKWNETGSFHITKDILYWQHDQTITDRI